MRFPLLCAALLSLCFVVSCSRDYREFEDSSGRFTVDYPRTWDIKPGSQTGVAVTFESRMEGYDDDFPENFSVTAGDIPAGLNEESFAKAAAEAPKAYIPKFKLLSQEPFPKAKYPSFRVVYSGELAGVELMWEQYFFVRKGMGYSIIFTISAKKMDAYRPAIDHVVKSFRIRN